MTATPHSSLASGQDERDLAEMVAAFAARQAPTGVTRAAFESLGAGDRPDSWGSLVSQGLSALHLPETVGGGGAGLMELAVVVEQLGKALYPGGYLPTVLASAVLAASTKGAHEVPAASELLVAFADGATGALVLDDELVAEPTGADWVISGCTRPVLGLPGADIVLVRASTPDGTPVWFRLVPGDTAIVVPLDGTDLTRSVGRLELDRHPVSAAMLLPSAPVEQVDLVVNTLLAAEASGVAAWCLDTAVDYARTRHQFGRPIGSFQAIQHKCAQMLVRAEVATAAAWDAARAVEHTAAQQRLAAASAAVTALPAAVDVAMDCVLVLGGIGYTWEHDAHLYWRRAVALASAGGAEESWAAILGEAAIRHRRDFSFVDAGDRRDLRTQVAGVLDQVTALPDDGGPGGRWTISRGGERRRILADAGLVAPHYPPPYGLGAGPLEQAVVTQEFEAREVQQPTTVIGEWVLPTLLTHGSPEQQDRFVTPTLRGEIVWCQLFSEPGAGSDLAGLSTRARRVDGGWSLTGQKVWNSMAHEADWGVCLARTDPDAAKHRGISYFLIDMRSAGVDVRPLRQATGRSEFNEVFLDEVYVPDDCLVGAPGDGWRLATTTLANERLNMGSDLGHGGSDLLRRLLHDQTHAASRGEVVRVLGRNTAREIALSALNLRAVLARVAGIELGASVSVAKAFNALAQRDGSRAVIALLGPTGLADENDGHYVMDHISLPAVLFGGGTIEIQLNLIAKRVLGLP